MACDQSAISWLTACLGYPDRAPEDCARCTPPRAQIATRAYGMSQLRTASTQAMVATRHTPIIAKSSLPLTYLTAEAIRVVVPSPDATDEIVYAFLQPSAPAAIHMLAMEATAIQLMLALKPVKHRILTGQGCNSAACGSS